MAKQELDAELIRKLAALLEETGLTEIEFANQTVRVKVGRSQPMPSYTVAAPAPTPTVAATPAPSSAAPAADHPGLVKSPMVGTVYLSAEPGAPPYVSPGTVVKAGQTLLIIEAMKVMNPVTAPVAGTIGSIFAKDAQPVEFGESLLIIEA
jgi:acetyl-CoA carboxylase biotin carboxyl carrier protein